MSTNRANANSAEELWHYAVGSDKRGPVSQAALAKLLAAGEISAETYVWQPGMDNWVHLSEAGPLKELVSGLMGEAPQEAFVEEDTTFMPSSQLQAAHREMSKAAAGGELSQDTVVESIDSLFGAGGLAAAAQSFKADEARVAQATAQTLLQPAEVLSTPAAAPAKAAAAAAPAAAAKAATDDIFASASNGSNPFGDDNSAAGVHARSQSSVLFKLDDLGREQGAGGGKSGGDAFVTDSSGLIDIKAVATSAKPTTGDPFSGANLVMPPRTAAAPLSVPLVGKRRGAGPWIFASVALLAIAGAVIAVVVLGKETPAPAPAPAPAVVAEANNPATPAPTEAAKPAEPATPPAAPADKPAEPAAPAVDPAKAEADAKAAAEADAAAKAAAEEAEKAAAAKNDKKPATGGTTARKTDTKTEPTKTEPKVEPVAVAPKPTTGAGAAKVDNLLAQLDSGGGKTAEKKDSGDGGSLPDKLTAAAVRNGIRGRFEGCAAKAGGSFTVQTSFVISSSGVVQSARITDAGGTSADVQKCVVQQIKDTTFGQFKDSSMTVNLPVRLN